MTVPPNRPPMANPLPGQPSIRTGGRLVGHLRTVMHVSKTTHFDPLDYQRVGTGKWTLSAPLSVEWSTNIGIWARRYGRGRRQRWMDAYNTALFGRDNYKIEHQNPNNNHLSPHKNKGPGTEAHFSNPPPLLRRASVPAPPPPPPPPAEQLSGCLTFHVTGCMQS